jgi:hypothetical protein
VPSRTPEEVLASHGLYEERREELDPASGLAMATWQRSFEQDR